MYSKNRHRTLTRFGQTIGTLLCAFPGVAAAQWDAYAGALDLDAGTDATTIATPSGYESIATPLDLPEAPYSEGEEPGAPPLLWPMSDDAAGGIPDTIPLPPGLRPPIDAFPMQTLGGGGVSCPSGLRTPDSITLPDLGTDLRPSTTVPSIEAFCGIGVGAWVGDGRMSVSASAYAETWVPAGVGRRLKGISAHADLSVDAGGVDVDVDVWLDGDNKFPVHATDLAKAQDGFAKDVFAGETVRIDIPLPADFTAGVSLGYSGYLHVGLSYEASPVRASVALDTDLVLAGHVWAGFSTPRICIVDWFDFLCWGGDVWNENGDFTVVDDHAEASAAIYFKHTAAGSSICARTRAQNTVYAAMQGGIPGVFDVGPFWFPTPKTDAYAPPEMCTDPVKVL